MRDLSILLVLAMLLGCASSVARAGSPKLASSVAQVRSLVDSAYGGARLRSLKTVSISTDRRLAWPGQGQSATFVEFATDKQVKHFDLRKRQGSVERWIHQTGSVYHDRFVVDGRGAHRVDYALMTVSDVPKQTYASAFAGDFRFSDLLLAHHVVTHADAVSGAKPVTYLGRRHHRLAVRMAAEEKPFDVYVDAETGLLTRVEIQRPFGLVNVIFSRHARSDGVRYAKENRSFLGDRLVEYDTDCTVTVNQDIGAAIRVEESLRPAPEMVDTSTMTVDRLGPDLYLVGRDDYSLFVEHAGRFIAVSTYAGFGARVDALGAELGRDIELSDVIVTQHHDDQLAGVEEAVKRGASLWVTGEARKVLAATSRAEGAAVRVLAEEQSIGPLTVFVRATGHAQESAFVFHERRGVLFQDLYHALYRNRANWAQPTAIAMHRMLVEWSWPVRVLVSGHGRKAEAWSAFEAAVERSAPRPMCPSQREICQELFLR